MSRRKLLWLRKLGYDPMPPKSSEPRGAWKVSQCGGLFSKLLSTLPKGMKRDLPVKERAL